MSFYGINQKLSYKFDLFQKRFIPLVLDSKIYLQRCHHLPNRRSLLLFARLCVVSIIFIVVARCIATLRCECVTRR